MRRAHFEEARVPSIKLLDNLCDVCIRGFGDQIYLDPLLGSYLRHPMWFIFLHDVDRDATARAVFFPSAILFRRQRQLFYLFADRATSFSSGRQTSAIIVVRATYAGTRACSLFTEDSLVIGSSATVCNITIFSATSSLFLCTF